MLYLILFSSFIIAFSVTYIFVPFLCFFAKKLGVLDIPDGKLKTHVSATPYLGGIAVFCGFIISIILFFPFEKKYIPFFIGLMILLVLGFVDDIVQSRPYQKFIGQVLASLLFLVAGLVINIPHTSEILLVLVSFFWFLSVINAFNLVDVMDGLATILALTAASSFFVLAVFFSQYEAMIFLSALIGALVAFFRYNKPPALIYLGDSGALFIGGCCAAIPMLLPLTSINPHGYLAPAGILGIVLLEGFSLIIIRIYKKIPFYLGSPDHFYIYLQKKGFSKIQILWYVGSMSTVASIVACLFTFSYINLASVIIAALLFLTTWFLVLI